jgi:hypothetical protein
MKFWKRYDILGNRSFILKDESISDIVPVLEELFGTYGRKSNNIGSCWYIKERQLLNNFLIMPNMFVQSYASYRTGTFLVFEKKEQLIEFLNKWKNNEISDIT